MHFMSQGVYRKKDRRVLLQQRGVYFMTSFGLGRASVGSHIPPPIMMNCSIRQAKINAIHRTAFLVTLLSIPRTRFKLFNISVHISFVAKAVEPRDCKGSTLTTKML